MFENKIKGNPNITLIAGNNLITDKKSISEAFNDYLVNVVLNLGVNMLDDNSGKGDASIYDNHLSMISIKQHITEKNKVFYFRKVAKGKISCLPKSFSSLVKFFRIFFLVTSIVAWKPECFLMN